MILSFDDEAWDDYLYWQRTDPKMVRRINEIIKDINRDPFDGIGKPEALQHDLSGFWSRRIDREHRLVYEVTETAIVIIKCRYHY